jgi:hypothetical protein
MAMAVYALASSSKGDPWIPQRGDVFAPLGIYAISGYGAFSLALAIQVAS